MADSTSSLWRSAARFFSGTMLSRITGLLRDMAMAYGFGAQSSIAAFLLAFRLAHLLRRLLGEGAMQSALIPHFEQLRQQDQKLAGRFFWDLGCSLAIFLIVLITFIMMALQIGIVYLPMSKGNQEICWLTLLMMPSLLFISLFGINAALLQCEKKYFIVSAAPIGFNLFWIAGIFSTCHLPPDRAMVGMAFFIIIACFTQWAVTMPQVICILKSFQLGSFFRHTKIFSEYVLKLSKPLALGILGIAASQINSAMDALFARWAAEEGPAILWYALRLQQLPLALFGIALSGALLPPLSRSVKNGNYLQAQQFLEFAFRNTLGLMLPITAFFLIRGEACVHLLFGHGDFSLGAARDTTHALWGYTVGLIPMALTLVTAPAFYAYNDFRTPSLAATGSMVLNLILNALLITVTDLGATSVAIATSISAWCNFAWLTLALNKKQDLFHLRVPLMFSYIGKALLLCLSASCLCYFTLGWNSSLVGELLEMALSVGIFAIFSAPLFVKSLQSGTLLVNFQNPKRTQL